MNIDLIIGLIVGLLFGIGIAGIYFKIIIDKIYDTLLGADE